MSRLMHSFVMSSKWILWVFTLGLAIGCREPESSGVTDVTSGQVASDVESGDCGEGCDTTADGDDATEADGETADGSAPTDALPTDAGVGDAVVGDATTTADVADCGAGCDADATTTDGAGDAGSDGTSADADVVAPDPCAGIDCDQHGTCYPLYDQPICQCEVGYYRVGATHCKAEAAPGACFPNPCKGPDMALCDEVGGVAVCGCDVGFSLKDGSCAFLTCPDLQATTGVTVYDQTGGSVKGGFDPLLAGDVVKVRVEVEVHAGQGPIELELRGDNFDPDLTTLSVAGKAPVQPAKTKGPLLLVPLVVGPGVTAIELRGKMVGAWAPLSIDARLTAPGACELPNSRSGARLGPLGLLDAKGFGCIDLDRSHSVQIAAEIVEKSTSVYGKDNGTNQNYSPSGTIVATMTQCFIRHTDRALFLAGGALGHLPWGVDNYFVVEPFDHEPKAGEKPTQALVLQAAESVAATGGIQKIPGPHGDVRGTHIGVPNGGMFGWSAGVVRLDALVAKGKPTWLRFYALDHGVVGRLTRVYVHSRPPAAAPPECVLDGNCSHLGKGCVKGVCKGDPCSSTCGGDGVFCVANLCTSRCDKGGGQCPAGEVCALQRCVPAATPGICQPSQQDQDCPKGSTCHWGLCETGCHHPRQQNQSYALNNDFCKTPGLCPHCAEPTDGCWNNVCAECEIDPHCPNGSFCVDRSCAAALAP